VSAPRLVRFGVFEFDLRSGDLSRAGARLNLPSSVGGSNPPNPKTPCLSFAGWADFDFLIVALIRLRRAARLAARIPQLQALGAALAQFDRALPDLKKMRAVAEHIDDYALDQGRQRAVARQSLEVSTMEAEGPTLHWLQARLNAREASCASPKRLSR
jgi:hypothetical protein